MSSTASTSASSRSCTGKASRPRGPAPGPPPGRPGPRAGSPAPRPGDGLPAPGVSRDGRHDLRVAHVDPGGARGRQRPDGERGDVVQEVREAHGRRRGERGVLAAQHHHVRRDGSWLPPDPSGTRSRPTTPCLRGRRDPRRRPRRRVNAWWRTRVADRGRTVPTSGTGHAAGGAAGEGAPDPARRHVPAGAATYSRRGVDEQRGVQRPRGPAAGRRAAARRRRRARVVVRGVSVALVAAQHAAAATACSGSSRSSGLRSRSPSAASPAAEPAAAAPGASAAVEPDLPQRLQLRAAQRRSAGRRASAAQSSPCAGHLLQEAPQQRRAQLGVDLVRDHLGRHQQRVDLASPRTAAALAGRFCRAATNRSGLIRRAAATSDRFVVSLSVPATKPDRARSRSARASTLGSERVADDRRPARLAVARPGSMIGDLQALGPQVRGQLPAEPAVAAHHPAAVRSAAGRARAARRPGRLSSQVSSW